MEILKLPEITLGSINTAQSFLSPVNKGMISRPPHHTKEDHPESARISNILNDLRSPDRSRQPRIGLERA